MGKVDDGIRMKPLTTTVTGRVLLGRANPPREGLNPNRQTEIAKKYLEAKGFKIGPGVNLKSR